MQAKITKSTIDSLPLGSMVWDQAVRGFGARRQLRDTFYVLRYRLNGRQRLVTIGRHGSPWTPDTARNEARRLLGLVAGKVDPAAPPPTETFITVIDRYLERKRPSLKPRSILEIERHLLHHSKPLRPLRLAEIDRRTIAVRLGEIETANGPIARNRVRSSLSAFFAWSIHEGLLEINPVSGTGKADEGGSRERILSQGELTALLKVLGNDQFSDIIRLLILTGQRREEIGGLRWSEIDLNRNLIILPPARTKNNRQHELPLSKQAREVLERQPKRGRETVFGIGEGGFSGWSDAKAALDLRLSSYGGGCILMGWRLHDLRRSAATMMAELGILPHIIEAILNHVSGHRAGVAGIYNRARYEIGMRDGLQRWADWIDGLTPT
jgi:integrase